MRKIFCSLHFPFHPPSIPSNTLTVPIHVPTELLERGEAEKEVKSLILDKMSYCRSLQEVLVKFVDDVSKIQMHERVIIPNSYVEDSDCKEE